MSAIGKTKNLLRLDLPTWMLEKNEDNPNKMSSREFDLLCDNIEQTGLTDPILVRPVNFQLVSDIVKALPNLPSAVETSAIAADCRFRIVGGHHRFEAASYLGFEKVPVTVIMDPDFDADRERFQLVRMNAIRGKMDPQRFLDLLGKLNTAYTEEVLQDAFGFADEAEWRKLVDQAAKTLPDKKMQAKFKEAALEVKTIDQLSQLLNKMFSQYGDTLPYGYMIVDYGGQRSMWVRAEKKTMDALDLIAEICIKHERTMDDVIGGVVHMIAKGELPEQLDAILKKTPQTKVPAGIEVLPTKDNLAKIEAAYMPKAAPGAYKTIKSLGPEAMAEIDQRLRDGESPNAVAAWIQTDLGQLADVKPDTLKKTLQRYRDKELRPRVLEELTDANKGRSVASVAKRLNAMVELEDLAWKQKGRVEKLLLREAQMPAGLLVADTKHEMRLLRDTLVDLGRLQMETGLIARAPRKFTGTLTNPDGSVAEFAWTTAQEALFKQLDDIQDADFVVLPPLDDPEPRADV